MDGGEQYHMPIHSEKLRWWMLYYLIQSFAIDSHFSYENVGHVAAHKYICKDNSADSV